jgi:hypothetical protein
MIREGILFLMLGSGVVVASDPPVKPRLQATITDLYGKPVAFRALSLGGDLTVQAGQRQYVARNGAVPNVERVRPQDTLRVTTPKSFWLDLTHGPIVFFTTSGDSIRVVVSDPPGGTVRVASGRRVTLSLSNSPIVMGNRLVVADTR